MEKIFTAKTLDEAKQMAADEFGVDRLDIDFEIIEQPAKKLFGTKGDFRVRATASVKAVAPPEAEPEKSVSAPLAAELATPEQQAVPANVIGYLSNILTALGVSGFAVNVKPSGENVVLDVTGDDLGIIIGRRGETLDSLQYLAILANNRGDGRDKPRVIVDCNGYREKRAETLETLAERTAAKVLKAGRRITLEPMNPYERRIIHSKVAEIGGVFSNSIGEEPFRKVVISAEVPKRRPTGAGTSGGTTDTRESNESKPGNSGSRGSGGAVRKTGNSGKPGNSGGVTGRTYKQSSGFSTSFEREYKRAPAPEISEETAEIEKNTSLYGKIEL